MNVRTLLKRAIHGLTGLHITRTLPFGTDQFQDLRTYFPDHHFRTIFDVGANRGQSAVQMRSHFPHATIHCFEPIGATYRELIGSTKHLDVHCHQIAFGATEAEMEIGLKANTEMNSLREPVVDPASSEKIRVTTLSAFCASNAIDTIDLLKVDTEGFDLEVLKGARTLLAREAIGFIEVEAGLGPENTYHVRLEDVRQLLSVHGYRIFGIYQQTHEWLEKLPVIRRVNVVFVPRKIAASARGRYVW